MSIFGYDAFEDKGIKDGEIVRCIFLKRTFPYNYQKKIKELQTKEEQIAKDTGLPEEPITMNYKEGGVAWEFGVLDRLNTETGEFQNTLVYDDGNPVLPDYNIFGAFVQPTPEFIHDNNLGFAHIVKGGIAKRYNSRNEIMIISQFPPTLPAKDYKTGLSADDLTDENRDVNLGLWEQENLRKANWNLILAKWEKVSEEKALNQLEDMIASRLLLYLTTDAKLRYIKPEPGIMFTAKVVRKGKYIDLIAFEWNKDSIKYDYYGNGIEVPYADDRHLADTLLELREKYFEQLTLNKQLKAETAADADVEFAVTDDSEEEQVW